MKSLVSIIMGAYNCEKTISKAIDSIVEQTFTEWEFIICDDGSRDNTLKILREYEKKDSRFKILVNDKNLGLAATLNKCIDFSKGKYIARMDADDESLKDRLLLEYEFLETHPEYALCGASAIIFDDHGEYGIRSPKERPQKSDFLYGGNFIHPTVMIRTSVLKALGGYTSNKNTTRAEDLDLWFRLYHDGYIGYNIQKPLYRYREGLEDYKKRTIKAGFQTRRVYLSGYKLIGIKGFKKLYSFKPVISALLPNKYMFNKHRKRLKPVTSINRE